LKGEQDTSVKKDEVKEENLEANYIDVDEA